MEEKKTTNISLSTFLFIIALIIIAVMGICIYKLNNEKTVEIQKAIDLQAQVNSLNGSVSNLQEKINTISETLKSDTETTNNVTTSNNDKTGVALEQRLDARLGIVYISTNGEVYFDPSNYAELYFGEKVDISKCAKDLLGEPKKYDIKSNYFMMPDGHHTFRYKLDLSDVRSVSEFYFGNGGNYFALVFIHNNGNISELSYINGNLKLYKNVSGYSNIVSIVIANSSEGDGAILYDKYGNGIDYTPAGLKNN